MFATRVVMLVFAAGVSAPVWAQAPEDSSGRGVVRVSLLNGDVSVRRGDSGDFIAAGVNQPLVVQDRLVTGLGSRAELQFDWANFLRVAGNAEVRLAELEHRRYLVQIARGTVTWRVLRDADAYIEISTPSVSVRPTRKGIYRVTVQEDGSSEITVRSGEAEIFTPRGSERLRSGRTMMARGSASDPEFRVVPEVNDDDWDRWNIARDRDLERSRSYDYISRDIYGAEDLDLHGRWMHVPSYGWVWSPRVAVGWAPYRYGRWAWVDWYGWSWVSYDPWGWAPYHYGRWFYQASTGWCWWPGGIGVRHYWSPGLVAFVGFGRANVGYGWGRVGWIPLAPYEPYHRWYGSRWYGTRSRAYIDNSVTVVNNVNITNVYRNTRIDRAVTIVDHDGFRRGRQGEGLRGGDEFRQASVAHGPLPVTPERDSQRVADREPSVRSAETRSGDRFFSNRRPAEVERVSFDDQRRGVEQIARRSFADEGTRATPVPESARGTDAAAHTTERGESQRGWRRVGESPGTGVTTRSAEAAGRTGGPAAAAEGSGRTPEAGVSRSERSDTDWRRSGSPRVAEGADASRAEHNVGGTPGVSRSERSGSDTDWRRFGAPRLADGTDANQAGRGAQPADTSAGRGERGVTRSFGEPATSGGEGGNRGADTDWRRFGSGGVRSDSGSRESGWRRSPDSSTTRDSVGGWRRDLSPGSSDAPARGTGSDSSTRSPRMDSPSRSERSISPDASPRMETPRMEQRDWGGSRGSESIRISPPIVRERGSSGRGDSGVRSAPSGGDFGGRGGRSFEGTRSAPSGGTRSSGGSSGGSSSGRGGRGR